MKEKHLWKVASVLIAMLMGLAMVVSCSKDNLTNVTLHSKTYYYFN